jgi:hypothetical protein
MGLYLRVALLLAAALALQGCVAKAALDVATAPVKVASKGVDLATTSQSEADRNRGRDMRKREEKLGKLERDYDRQSRDCQDGDGKACDKARATYAEIEQIRPTIPARPAD